MSETLYETIEDQGEKTLLAYFRKMKAEMSSLEHDLLNELARALIERGWLPPIDTVLNTLKEMMPAERVDAARAELEHRRLVQIESASGNVTGLLGTLSVARTPHRAHMDGGIDVYTHGGMDLLGVSGMLLKSVDIHTACPISGTAITMRIEDGQIVSASPNGVAGFQANWNGELPLSEVAENSPLFASDEALETWQANNPFIAGTALPADLLLWVGMSMVEPLAAARFALIGHESG